LTSECLQVDGFDVLRAVAPKVAFVTAHERFAVRAFEVHDLGYLMKPFSRDRFQTALGRSMQRIAGGGITSEARILGLLEELHTKSKPPERLPRHGQPADVVRTIVRHRLDRERSATTCASMASKTQT
jgi:DNA-binding LytR/AlgR family response regulator